VENILYIVNVKANHSSLGIQPLLSHSTSSDILASEGKILTKFHKVSLKN